MPICRLATPFVHPNVYPSGRVHNAVDGWGENWDSTVCISDVMKKIQKSLDEQDMKSPAQQEGYELFMKRPEQYRTCVKAQTTRFAPEDFFENANIGLVAKFWALKPVADLSSNEKVYVDRLRKTFGDDYLPDPQLGDINPIYKW